MKYYTAKGDTGTTTLFVCPQDGRLSKADGIFEVLGGVDELNCFIGWCRAVAERSSFCHGVRAKVLSALSAVQSDLFIVQAELGGGKKRLSKKKVVRLGQMTEQFANMFPPIHAFVIPGGTELGALLDVSRTVARRVERLYIRNRTEKKKAEGFLSSYLNRTSSLLYVLARYANHSQGVTECSPTYR